MNRSIKPAKADYFFLQILYKHFIITAGKKWSEKSAQGNGEEAT